jgi:hypothetical protein
VPDNELRPDGWPSRILNDDHGNGQGINGIAAIADVDRIEVPKNLCGCWARTGERTSVEHAPAVVDQPTESLPARIGIEDADRKPELHRDRAK